MIDLDREFSEDELRNSPYQGMFDGVEVVWPDAYQERHARE